MPLSRIGGAGQDLHARRPQVREGALGGDGEGLEPHDVLRPSGQVHLPRRDHRGDAAVQGGLDPAELVLAGRPVAEHRVDVAVDEPRREAGAACVDGGVRAARVAVALLPDGGDPAVVHHDRVGVEDRALHVPREHEPDVPDDDLARLGPVDRVCHGPLLSPGGARPAVARYTVR
jgi:hypothetical protein